MYTNRSAAPPAASQPPVTSIYSSAAVSRAQYPAVRNHGLAQPAA